MSMKVGGWGNLVSATIEMDEASVPLGDDKGSNVYSIGLLTQNSPDIEALVNRVVRWKLDPTTHREYGARLPRSPWDSQRLPRA